jgi:hypothetical protein
VGAAKRTDGRTVVSLLRRRRRSRSIALLQQTKREKNNNHTTLNRVESLLLLLLRCRWQIDRSTINIHSAFFAARTFLEQRFLVRF